MSDFGLTKFKDDLQTHTNKETAIPGSIHWTAPELLNESPVIDYMMADIYSFGIFIFTTIIYYCYFSLNSSPVQIGIVLWELLTRDEPYAGLR